MPTTFPEAYRRLVHPVRAKCRRMLGNTAAAEDVVQETFVRLWCAGPRLVDAGTGTLTSWLYRTCTRLSIDVLRQRGRAEAAVVHTLHASALASASPPSLHDTVEARACIASLSARVPADELEAALLVRVDGMSQPEAASAMRVSERTVRRLLERFDERVAELRRDGAPAQGRDRAAHGRLRRVPILVPLLLERQHVLAPAPVVIGHRDAGGNQHRKGH